MFKDPLFFYFVLCKVFVFNIILSTCTTLVKFFNYPSANCHVVRVQNELLLHQVYFEKKVKHVIKPCSSHLSFTSSSRNTDIICTFWNQRERSQHLASNKQAFPKTFYNFLLNLWWGLRCATGQRRKKWQLSSGRMKLLLTDGILRWALTAAASTTNRKITALSFLIVHCVSRPVRNCVEASTGDANLERDFFEWKLIFDVTLTSREKKHLTRDSL